MTPPWRHAARETGDLEARLSIVEALLTSHLRWSEVQDVVSGASDLSAAGDAVGRLLGIGQPEVFHVLDMQLHSRTEDARRRTQDERDAIVAELARRREA
jgi:hypothetical protein